MRTLDYKRNEKYFKPLKLKLPIILIIIGLILFFISPVVGVVVLIVGALILALQFIGRPSDDEFDKIAHSTVGDIKSEALSKLGVDEDEVKLIEPITFEGYDFHNISSQSWYKLGKDGNYRSSNYEGCIFLFSENQVYFYSKRVSLIKKESKINTDEYLYNDLVSAATTSEVATFKNNKGKDESYTYEHFVLTSTGGTKTPASIQTNDPSTEESIKGMKQLIRQKKMEAQNR